MAARRDQTMKSGWDGDLMDLQNETQKLLATVRSTPSRSRSTKNSERKGSRVDDGLGKKKKKRKQKTTTEEKKTSSFKTTLDLGRETVEILDTASNPVSARSSDGEDELDLKQTRGVGTTVRFQQTKQEITSRNLDFETEKSRVSEEKDTYVSSKGGKLEDLDNERRRLRQIDAKNKNIEFGAESVRAEQDARQTWLEDDRSIVRIQKLIRGHFGRNKVRLVAERLKEEKKIQAAWVEVRDQETGDVWFFNEVTGESQWEMPEALEDLMPRKERLKKLPSLVNETPQASDVFDSTVALSQSQNQTNSGFPSMKSSGGARPGSSSSKNSSPRVSPRSNTLPSINRQPANNQKEVFFDGITEYPDDDEDIMEMKDDNMFLADGSVKGQLRDTIGGTLKMSRFDSVATLLMGPGPAQEEGKKHSSQKKMSSDQGADRKPVIGNTVVKKPMVSLVKGKAGSSPMKKGRPVVGESNAGSAKSIKSLAIRDVSHPGFDISHESKSSSSVGNSKGVSKVSEICFNCWSAGKGKFCALHVNEERLDNNKNGSTLMCKNWNLGVLLKRYRSEDIQEIFMKSASCLKFDKDRKRFVTVEEQKHPIYRSLSNLLSRYNFTVRRKIHQAIWLRSFVEHLRSGKLHKDGASKAAGMLKLRNTMYNSKWVRQYASSVAHLHPKGPVTGTTLAERRGLLHHLVCRGELSYIFAAPIPMPEALYLPRRYELPAPRAIPMPRPSYKEAPQASAPNHFIDESLPVSWFERYTSRVTREALSAAALQVAALSPMPGVELLRRTKYAPPQTIKFASLARKPTKGNLAVGGLAAELTVHELVQTVVPPQFGNYTVMHKAAVAPNISEEITASFDPSPSESARQVFVFRPLQHPLNSRSPPTIMVPTGASEFEKHFYGPNRPEQTGEEISNGFRTSCFASGCDSILIKETSVQAFEPSSEVSTPNLPAANQTVTTHVDYTYPFCEPSNRNNTTLDFYHLLLFGTCAPNKEQVFTNFGTQECGEFMKDTDIERPMGPCASNVYRSWAFVQRQMVEEFVTDDGLPYWFDRKTGETFWERPLAQEELVPVKEGGTVLDRSEASDAEGRNEDMKKKYRQDDVRKVILKKHETAEDMIDRRKLAAQSAKWAREEGIFKTARMAKAALKASKPKGAPASVAISPPNVMDPNNRARTPGASPPGGGAAAGMRSPNNFNAGNMSVGSASIGSAAGTTGGAPMNGNTVENLTAALSGLLPQLQQGGASPMDLVQLGMGLGMSLQGGGAAPNTLALNPNVTFSPSVGSHSVGGGSSVSGSDRGGDPFPNSPNQRETNEPIGVVDPNQSSRIASLLDHSGEVAQREVLTQVNPNLSTVEQYRGLEIVPSETPDEEVEGHIMHVSREEEARKQVPVFAFPAELLGRDYTTHDVAGAGVSFLPEGEGTEQNYVAESKRTLRRAGDVLPEGFFNAIYSTHVGKAEVDYLPSVPNLPQPRPVGRVKPRSAAEDWFAIGFDPWSAGKDPLSREFIPSLLTKEEALLEQARKRSDAAFIEVMDGDGAAALEAEASMQQQLLSTFEELSSYVRHSKYREIEDVMNSPDFTLPVDFQDEAGNTLLLIAAQNGVKRIAKLLLRRGASINKQNMAGQTVLHYAQGYGFMDLFEYFMSKGADDSMKNADGLTCYEGLDLEDVQNI